MKLFSNASWLTGGRVTADALSALLFVAISRRFGPSVTGVYAYAFSISGFVLAGSALGLEPFGVREYARSSPEGRTTLLGRLLTTQVSASALAITVAIVYLLLTRAPAEVAVLTLALACYQVGLSLAQTLFVPASASEAMRAPAIADMACRGGAVLVALAVVLLTDRPLVVAIASFPAAGAACIAMGLVSARRRGAHPRLHAEPGAVATTLRAVWPIAGSELVYQIFARADLIMLTLLAGAAAAGIYASGFKFIEVGITPMIFLASAAYPRLSRYYQQGDGRFGILAAQLLLTTLGIGGVVAWALMFLVPVVVVPVFGERFAAAAGIVRLMAGLAALWAIEIAASRILISAHRQVWALRMHAAGAAVNVALNLVLIPRYGVPGAVAATVAALAIMTAFGLHAVLDLFPRHTLNRILFGWAGTLAVTAVVGTAALRLGHSLPAAALAALAAFALGMVATSAASGRIRLADAK